MAGEGGGKIKSEEDRLCALIDKEAFSGIDKDKLPGYTELCMKILRVFANGGGLDFLIGTYCFRRSPVEEFMGCGERTWSLEEYTAYEGGIHSGLYVRDARNLEIGGHRTLTINYDGRQVVHISKREMQEYLVRERMERER